MQNLLGLCKNITKRHLQQQKYGFFLDFFYKIKFTAIAGNALPGARQAMGRTLLMKTPN